jgi:hypothetical protein
MRPGACAHKGKPVGLRRTELWPRCPTENTPGLAMPLFPRRRRHLKFARAQTCRRSLCAISYTTGQGPESLHATNKPGVLANRSRILTSRRKCDEQNCPAPRNRQRPEPHVKQAPKAREDGGRAVFRPVRNPFSTMSGGRRTRNTCKMDTLIVVGEGFAPRSPGHMRGLMPCTMRASVVQLFGRPPIVASVAHSHSLRC